MRSYLIVDDNQPLAENLAEILHDQGDDARVMRDPAHALEEIRRRRFHALITDMRMPVMSGAQLLAEARKVDPGLAAIVLTAYTGETDLSDVQRDGVLAVLPKPVPIARMVALLASAKRDGLVLLIEDDSDLTDNLTEAFQTRGFSTVVTRSGDETRRLGGVRPFVALVDLRVPGSPGGEILSHVSERFHGIPLLAMTGYPEIAPPFPTQRLFAKPFVTRDLLDTLEGLHHARTPT